MTESEAIEGLGILNNGLNEAFVNADELSEALQMAIQALEEVQRNRKHKRVPCVERKADSKETAIYCKFRLYSIMVMPSMRKKNNQK